LCASTFGSDTKSVTDIISTLLQLVFLSIAYFI